MIEREVLAAYEEALTRSINEIKSDMEPMDESEDVMDDLGDLSEHNI